MTRRQAGRPGEPGCPDASRPGPLQEARAAYAAEDLGRRMPIPGVAGFVGGWTLFHEVLPKVKGAGVEKWRR